jgi:hypothetical protein
MTPFGGPVDPDVYLKKVEYKNVECKKKELNAATFEKMTQTILSIATTALPPL